MKSTRFVLLVALFLAAWTTLGAYSNSTAGPGSIAPTGEMSQPRSGHSATLLPDGKVLIAGGMVENGVFLETADVYDPATARFVALKPMSAKRVSHSATLLPNGKVLIAGGLQGREMRNGRWAGLTAASSELYDPQTKTFSATGPMITARNGHDAILLSNGKVLILGGWDGERYVESTELYDPASGKFSAAGQWKNPRPGAVTVALQDGRVLLCGGDDANGKVSARAEIYDPATSSATRVGDMAVALHKHAGVLLADGRVLITGGSDDRDWQGRQTGAELFDPKTGTFTVLPPMNATRFKHPRAAVLLKNGKVLIAGGNNNFEVFDAQTKKFATVPGSTGDPIFFAAATLLRDGKVLVTGGYGYGSAAHGPQATTHAWIYAP
jgi:hypothetical protein